MTATAIQDVQEKQHLFRLQEENNILTDQSRNNRTSKIKKAVIGVIFGTILVLVVIDSRTSHHVQNTLEILLQWMGSHRIAGILVFIGLYAVSTVLLVPGSVLTLGFAFICVNAFGLAWGMVVATVTIFLGASLGAMAAFLLGRYLFQPILLRRIRHYPLLQSVDRVLMDPAKAFRVMVMLRLSPLVPFNALNYMSGATSISFTVYSLALVALLPGTIFYVCLGATAGSFVESFSSNHRTANMVIITIGIFFGAFAIYLISHYAKNELRDIMDKEEEENAHCAPDEEKPQYV